MTNEAQPLEVAAAQPEPPVLLTPATIAMLAQAVAAHLAASAPAPVPEEPKPLPPLADPLWTGLVYFIKHGCADHKWDAWLRAKLGADFDEYLRLYQPGGEHHNIGTWDRVP